MKISIIFLCHNNKNIDLCVDVVYDQVIKGDEIIVVDDNSNIETLAVLEDLQSAQKIRLLQAKKQGNRSHNRNMGAKAAKNEILLFVDGDMVLLPKSLQSIRDTYKTNDNVACVGHKHNIRHSDMHSHFASGISQEKYIEMLQTEEGREQIAANPLFHDVCCDNFKNTNLEKYFWLYYYSGACTVKKSIWKTVGGFDESFTEWGGEDTEFGYRVSKHCPIKFIDQFHSIHIPHEKDVIKAEISSMNNIRKMIKKYNTWEFEVMSSFSSGLVVFGGFDKVINQMRLIDTQEEEMQLYKNTAMVYPVSSVHPNGAIYYFDNDKQLLRETLCLALDFKDRQFDKVFVAGSIFTYPTAITSRILQELCRVSKEVVIVPSKKPTRVDWKDLTHTLSASSGSRLIRRSKDISDFKFVNNSIGMIKVIPLLENLAIENV